MAKRLSKNFKQSEFSCQCGCGFSTPRPELVRVLQELRDELEESITITSACRCEAHNEAVGGAKQSQHLLGTAADIVVNKCTPAFIYEYLNKKYPDKYGLGKYNSFTHIDVRSNKSRW